MIEDFLFDPWSRGDAEQEPPDVAADEVDEPRRPATETEGVRPIRWRVRPAEPKGRRGGVHRPRAAAGPAGPLPGQPLAGARPEPPMAGAGTGQPMAGARPKPPRKGPEPPPAGAGASAATPSFVRRLRALAVPMIERTETRLNAAGHRTLLDDRLEATEPALRFRLIPRAGPFDETPAVAGSVLELAVHGSTVLASVWLDPVADEPTEESRVEEAEAGKPWMERLLMRFVAASLQGV